ncbi:conserved hypothetical protein (plasmid) [Gloeothece citriformis PCC 7424]|uniref:CopG family transcriptional regulator n=1 Tax=Gloeothece citriformis (strain PCC 7424) TaxID=65393 RepID=B7KMB5_GLOC7|nr:hypothetical protein [Gloeothece citriformis]ACK73937.1 conserved hypothetical protein [Gloeothece citriformis PCC 7424]
MSKQKIAITLDDNLVIFLDQQAGGNRSEYLNNLIKEERKKFIQAQLKESLTEELESASYQQEIKDWDGVVGDGINGER